MQSGRVSNVDGRLTPSIKTERGEAPEEVSNVSPSDSHHGSDDSNKAIKTSKLDDAVSRLTTTASGKYVYICVLNIFFVAKEKIRQMSFIFNFN